MEVLFEFSIRGFLVGGFGRGFWVGGLWSGILVRVLVRGLGGFGRKFGGFENSNKHKKRIKHKIQISLSYLFILFYI